MSRPTPTDPKLIQSYVRNKFFISTMLMESNSILGSNYCYYETLVFEWNEETKETSNIIDSEVHSCPKGAFRQHYALCEKWYLSLFNVKA